MIGSDVKRELLAVDWNFPEPVRGTVRALHWYPGTFPSELPSTIIQAVTGYGEIVYDPFGGIGTSGSEALRLGRRAWSVELNPVGALTAYVAGVLILLKRSKPELLDVLFTRLDVLISRCNKRTDLFAHSNNFTVNKTLDCFVGSIVSPQPAEFFEQLRRRDKPNIECLADWYAENTMDNIWRFAEVVAEEESATCKLFATFALSACLKTLSSQTRSWGHIADNVKPKEYKEKDVWAGLRHWIGRTAGVIERAAVSPSMGTCEEDVTWLWISLYDWGRETEEIQPRPEALCKLMITSPPYGDAIDYVYAHRLSYYLLGADDMEMTADHKLEIGARRRRSKFDSRERWATGVAKALDRQLKFVSQDGIVAIVMPHKSQGRDNGNRIVDDTMLAADWQADLRLERSIRSLRTRQAWTSIKQETISVFTKAE